MLGVFPILIYPFELFGKDAAVWNNPNPAQLLQKSLEDVLWVDEFILRFYGSITYNLDEQGRPGWNDLSDIDVAVLPSDKRLMDQALYLQKDIVNRFREIAKDSGLSAVLRPLPDPDSLRELISDDFQYPCLKLNNGRYLPVRKEELLAKVRDSSIIKPEDKAQKAARGISWKKYSRLLMPQDIRQVRDDIHECILKMVSSAIESAGSPRGQSRKIEASPFSSGYIKASSSLGSLIPPEAEGRNIKGKILIVEDSKNLRASLRIRLESEGYDVMEAGDGKEALERLADEKFDLIISDFDMPGMYGIELLAELKKREITTPMIMRSTDDMREKAYAAGAKEFLSKQRRVKDLSEIINKILKSKAGGSPLGGGEEKWSLSLFFKHPALREYRRGYFHSSRRAG